MMLNFSPKGLHARAFYITHTVQSGKIWRLPCVHHCLSIILRMGIGRGENYWADVSI